MKPNKLIFTVLCALGLSFSVVAHGVQVRWNIVPSTGAIRVWIEHWHGNAAGSGTYSSFPLNIQYTIGGVTTSQTYYGAGAVDDTHWSNLPGGGGSSAYLTGCSSLQNTYGDWVYWDFNPPACNTPVSLTIISGPSAYTTEACGNLYPVTINSSFNDNTGPAITANDITVAPSTASCGAVVTNYNVSAVDACGGSVSTSYSIAQGSTFPQGTTPVTVSSTDQYGNTSTSTFNVIVADNQAPTVLTQNANVSLQNGTATITAADIDNGSFDNACGGIASMSVSPNTFDCSNIGPNNVWLTVTDIYGNTATGSAMVNVTDPVAPSINGPGNITVTAQTGRCLAEVNYSVIASLYSCAIQQDLSSSPTAGLASGSSFPLGTTTNSFSVTDAQGRTANYSFDVTVVQPNPVGVNAGNDQSICVGGSTQLNASLFNLPAGSGTSNSSTALCLYDAYGGSCGFGTNLCNDGYDWFYNSGVSANYQAGGALSSIDVRLFYANCSNSSNISISVNGTSVYSFTPAYSCYCDAINYGSYPNTISLSDAQLAGVWNSGGTNTIYVHFSGQVAVSGVQAIVNASTSSFSWISGPNIADSNDPNTTVSPTTTSDYVAQYTTAEGCIATDTVTVSVNPLPSVSLANFNPISFYASPISLSGGSPAGGVYSGAGVSNGSFDPGATSIGLQTIYYTYTDANGCGNTDSATIDVIPCNIQLSETHSNVSCPGGNDAAIDLTTANTNNGESFNWTGPNGFTASAEDLNGLASGTYTVVVTDGNGCTETLSVVIVDNPDNTAPTILAQNVNLVLDANGTATIQGPATSTPVFDGSLSNEPTGYNLSSMTDWTVLHGNVDVDNFISSSASGRTIDLAGNTNAKIESNGSVSLVPGDYVINFLHLNNAGSGESSDQFKLTIGTAYSQVFTSTNSLKNESISFTVNASETAKVTLEQLGANDASGCFVADLMLERIIPGTYLVDGGSYDNCQLASLTASQVNFDCSDLGANTVVLMGLDASGNTASASAVVTVVDNLAPNVVTQNIAVALDANGVASISAADIDNGSSDVCGISSMSVSPSSFSCADVGVQTVTLSVSDASGNVATGTATVTISDAIAPAVSTQNAIVYLDASGNASISTGDIDNGSTDACGVASYSLDKDQFACADLGVNTVQLTVTDVNGNSAIASATVEVRDAINPVISGMPADITIVPQPNDCSPSVSWTAPSASDNCSVSLSSSHNPGDNFNVGATTVTYTATDAAGNSVSASFTVSVNPTPVTVSLSSPVFIGGDNISCNGAADGSVDLSANGGCEPYTYAWSNGSSAEDLNALTAGTYNVTVTDANGQTASASITLTEPAPVAASASSSGYLSGNGVTGTTLYLGYGPQSINLSASATGGHGPYAYSWSNGANTAATWVSPTATTTYTVTVTDVNGCSVSTSLVVDVVDARCAAGNSNGKGRANNGNGNGGQLTKVYVCHHGNTICIDSSAVASHLSNHNNGNHSCTLGACNGSAKHIDAPSAFDFSVYPNPNDGLFQVQIESAKEQDLRFVITDLQGRVIEIRDDFVVAGITELRFDLSNYATGVYLLEVVGAEEKQISRIIKN